MKYIAFSPVVSMNFDSSRRAHPGLQIRRGFQSYRRDANGLLTRTRETEPLIEYDESGNCLGLKTAIATTNLMIRTPVAAGTEPREPTSTTSGFLQNHPGLTLQAGAEDPAGGNTGFYAREQAVTGSKSIGMFFEKPTTGKYYCYSVFVKPAGRNILQLRWWSSPDGVSTSHANFDIQTGEVRGFDDVTSGAERYANGWWRIWTIALCEGAAGNNMHDVGCDIVPSIDSTRRQQYLGVEGLGYLIWGGQVEEVTDLKPNSIVVTSGSAMVTQGEMMTLPLRDLLSAGEGSLYVEFIKSAPKFNDASWQDLISLGTSAYTTSQRIAIVNRNKEIFLIKNNASPIGLPYDGIAPGSVVKACFSYIGTEVRLGFNGQTYVEQTASALNSFDTLRFGASPISDTALTSPAGAIYKKIKIYNQALDVDALARLTRV